uniref:Growth arrest and DNA-damage-inducible, gamma b, tandem duplicate 1 n=1 Tax=Hucho hucho TaxID=62062 RepID=A0A4W5R3U0_9TELE
MHHSGQPIRTLCIYMGHEPKGIKTQNSPFRLTNLFGFTLRLHNLSFTYEVHFEIFCIIMTLEEVLIQKFAERAHCTRKALEEVLLSAKENDCLTVGVYESAKVMNVDPDSVSFCVLATDEEWECDIALQIHFTLIQSFCFDNDISIVRVNDMQRLAEIIGDKAGQLEDAHCCLITVCYITTQSDLIQTLNNRECYELLIVSM